MKIASVGDNCIDIYVNSGNRSHVGGNAVNVAVAVKRSGVNCSYVGIVGNDANGAEVVDALQAEGIDTSHVLRLDGPTAWTHISLANNDRIPVAEHIGVQQQYRIAEESFRFISGHDFVHYTAFTNWPTVHSGGIRNYGELAGAHIARFHSDGVAVSIDFSDGDMTGLLRLAANKVDIGFFSRPGLDEAETKAEARELMHYGFRTVVITRGESGSCAYDGAAFTFQDIVPVRVVDTLGAGDAFIGAFLSKYAAGAAAGECLPYAAWYAAQVCGRFGGW